MPDEMDALIDDSITEAVEDLKEEGNDPELMNVPEEPEEEDIFEIEKEPELEPEPEPEEDDSTFQIKHNGREVDVGFDEMKNLAQKGFDYEDKMRGLKEAQVDYAGYEAMKEIMDGDPEVAERVRRAITGQSDATEPVREDFGEEHDGEGLGLDEDIIDTKTAKQVESLKNKVDELTMERQTRQVEEQQQQTEELIRSEVEKHPALKNAGEVAFAPILGILTMRPDADVSQVVNVVAEQFSKYEKSIRKEYVEAKSSRSIPSSPPRTASTPTSVSQLAFTSGDLDDGNVKRAAMAFLKQQTGEE